MKTRGRLTFLMICLAACALGISAPLGKANPGAIYAGTNGFGVFKSTDGGASWIPINVGLVGLTNLVVPAIVIDPTNPAIVYAGTQEGVFKSINGGASWSPASTGLPSDTAWMALAIDPANPLTLYAGVCPGFEAPFCPSGGAFKSTDGGASWSAINTGLTDKLVRALAIDPTQTLTVYAATNVGVSKSTNGGASWTPGLPGVVGGSHDALVIDPQNTSILYVTALTGQGVYKSTDAGVNWAPVSNGLPAFPVVEALDVNPLNPLTLYAGTFATGVFKTTDGGGNWAASNSGLPTSPIPPIRVLAVDPANPSTVYAGTDIGIFKSTNGGGSWAASSSGIPPVTVTSLAIEPATVPVMVSIDIKPGSDPNSINPKSRGTIPVAILSSSTLDAFASVDRTSLTFGSSGNENSLAFCNGSPSNINGDAFLDLMCHFDTQKTGFQSGDTEGVLKGETVSGTPIEGTDSVRIVP